MTSEGESVGLPLYVTLVGSAFSLNIVAFDVAGIIMNFILVPLMVARQTSGKMSVGCILRQVFTSPFVIAVILGVIANITGLYTEISGTTIGLVYDNAVQMVVAPITAMILFTLGYEFKISKDMIGLLSRIVITRTVAGIIIIIGFFAFFGDLMESIEIQLAVFIYFLCPPGFPMPLQLQPLCQGEERNENFMASFLPIYMIVTLIVYTILATQVL